jgi:lysozyme
MLARDQTMRLRAERDRFGKLLIGLGHVITRPELSSGTLRIGGYRVSWRDGITECEAHALLEDDISAAEIKVRRAGVARSQIEFDIQVSFCLCLGVGLVFGSQQIIPPANDYPRDAGRAAPGVPVPVCDHA